MEEAIRCRGIPSRIAVIPAEVLNDVGHKRGAAWLKYAPTMDPSKQHVTEAEIADKCAT